MARVGALDAHMGGAVQDTHCSPIWRRNAGLTEECLNGSRVGLRQDERYAWAAKYWAASTSKLSDTAGNSAFDWRPKRTARPFALVPFAIMSQDYDQHAEQQSKIRSVFVC